jgi:hypothetical protein
MTTEPIIEAIGLPEIKQPDEFQPPPTSVKQVILVLSEYGAQVLSQLCTESQHRLHELGEDACELMLKASAEIDAQLAAQK